LDAIWAVSGQATFSGNGVTQIGQTGSTRVLLRGTDVRIPQVTLAGGTPDDCRVSNVLRTFKYISSSLEYKKDFAPIELAEAYRFVKEIDPFIYTAKDDDEDPWRHPGYGMEPIRDAGFDELVKMGVERPGDVDGDFGEWVARSVKYDRVTTYLHRVLQDVVERLDLAGL
jgi:hypothetical protein